MLPLEARSWISSQDRDVAKTAALHSTQGEVWRVTLDDGRCLVLKRASRAAIDRECWGLDVARGIGSSPRVLARPAPELVVLSWHDGTSRVDGEVMRSAGVWLRTLHACEGAFEDPLPVWDAIGRRRDAWLDRAKDQLPGQTRNKLRAAIDPAVFSGLKRSACHRDYTPTNWLWDGALTVIDFGQARPDVALWDLVKLEAETFHESPLLRAAFFEGYGPLDTRDEERLRQLVLLHALQTAAWGYAHHDAAFSSLGRQILDRRLS